MSIRKTFIVLVAVGGISRGSVRLTHEDFVFNKKDALEYARMCLVPSGDEAEVFIDGELAWSGRFNKSLASRIRNKRLAKFKQSLKLVTD